MICSWVFWCIPHHHWLNNSWNDWKDFGSAMRHYQNPSLPKLLSDILPKWAADQNESTPVMPVGEVVAEAMRKWAALAAIPLASGLEMKHHFCRAICLSCYFFLLFGSLSYHDWSFNSRFKDIWRSGMLRYVSEMALQTWSGFAWHQGRNQVHMSWHVLCHSCS